MTNVEPAWRLTDDALCLVNHAEHDMARYRRLTPAGEEEDRATQRSFASGRRLVASTASSQWSRESAVVRIVTAVESYTDAASKRYFTLAEVAGPARTPFSWPQRRTHYENHHGFALTQLTGWERVVAGIDLRNCLAHGLGELTGILVRDETVAHRMQAIDVDVHSGRMHLRPTTVTLLAAACRDWLVDLEATLVASLPDSRI